MTKSLSAVLADLEDNLLLKRLSSSFVPACRERGAEFVYAVALMIISATETGQEVPSGYLSLEGLTPDEINFILPIVEAGAAVGVWETLPEQRKNKIVDDMKLQVRGGKKHGR